MELSARSIYVFTFKGIGRIFISILSVEVKDNAWELGHTHLKLGLYRHDPGKSGVLCVCVCVGGGPHLCLLFGSLFLKA